eukprot:7369932-Lingulodinium_polyedra.AAC.1
MGLAPSVLGRYRAMFARPLGTWRSGGCTTTAIVLGAGVSGDPLITCRQEILLTWVRVLASAEHPRGWLETAWAAAVARLARAGRGRYWLR